MNLRLKDILNLSIMKNAKLVTAHNRINTMVKWINVMEILDEYEQLQEGELLISTGYGLEQFTEQQFNNMIQYFVDKKIAALALQPGYYFDQIPSNLIKIANDKDFPIIQIPPRITWGKVTKAIHNEITKRNELFSKNDQAVHEYISYLIFDQDSPTFPFDQKAKKIGIDLYRPHLIAVKKIDSDNNVINNIEEALPYYKLIKSIFVSERKYKFYVTFIDNLFIILIETETKAPNVYEDLEKYFTRLLHYSPKLFFRMGVGNIYDNIFHLYQSYNEALIALKYQKTERHETTNYITYHSLGALGLLLECSDVKLYEYAKYHLGKLIKYDKQNGTNYLHTLNCYLTHLNHRETSNALFIHRHTLRYRLKKIEEILSVDLSSAQTIYNLYTSLLISKLLDGKDSLNIKIMRD